MSVAHFRVAFARPLDGAHGATITVDRSRMLLNVRLLHRRRLYTVPLAFLAEDLVWRTTKAETAERLKAKIAARKARAASRRKGVS